MKETAMECARFDWKAYALGELSAPEIADYKRHAGTCPQCRVELASWQTTVAGLSSLPQAEPPRRIVFASEAVAIEPWWQRMWRSGPQLGFASAAMLAMAIVAHALIARVPIAPAPAPPAQLEAYVHEAASQEVRRLLPQAVDAVLKQSVARQLHEDLNPALASFKRQLSQEEKLHAAGFEQKRDSDQKAVRYAFERLEQRVNYAMLSSSRPQGGQ